MASEIVKLVRQMVRSLIKDQVIKGIASNINFDEQTCDVSPLTGTADFIQVQLKGVIKDDDTGFIIYPKDGSEVSVCIIEGDESTAYVCQFTEIDSWLIHIKSGGQTVFKQHLKADGTLEWNDGQNGGLINIEAHLDSINEIKSDINDLKLVFLTTWIPVAQDGGAALKAAAAVWAGSQLIATQKAQIEDTSIVH